MEDALSATRAAVEEGVVAGGGTAFINARPALKNLKLTGDEAVGVEIVRRALEEPLRQIAINAGHDGGVIVAEVERKGKNIGFNAQTGEYENLLDVVPDPAKVTRSALQNAASIASMLLTTETLISDLPEKNQGPAAPSDAGLLNRDWHCDKEARSDPGLFRLFQAAFYSRPVGQGAAMVDSCRGRKHSVYLVGPQD